MQADQDETTVDWAMFAETRSTLGADFVRILGYFRDDGLKAVAAIETAMRAKNAAAMILPAHTLKEESAQFGAQLLSDLAEAVELHARDCVEWHEEPDQVLAHVVRLRPLLSETLEAFDRETNPLVERRASAKRVEVANQGFGRI